MMTQEVKIRYVNFGTRFQANMSVDRSPDSLNQPSDSRLFRNEVAFDVGGICHGYEGQTTWVFDHHFSRGDDNFPSAAAAVLHNAAALASHAAELHPQPKCFWLVTHVNPDFDALLSVYIAKFLLMECANGTLPDGSPISFIGQCLHPDGWRALPRKSDVNGGNEDLPRFPWFDPWVISGDKRWMLLLASTACHVDNGRPLHCNVESSLPSVFYAALARKRPYRGQSGADEFFNAARERIVKGDLNPLWDPLFAEHSPYAPELKLLAGSEAAYERDVARGRKSTVYLPFVQDFNSYFAQMTKRSLLDKNGDVDEEQICFSPSIGSPIAPTTGPRLQVDGIWIRDPECLLFRQYARSDQHNSPSGQGFLFTAIANSEVKTASDNRSDYFFSLDPERAAGRHLYPVWAALQAAEIHAIKRDPRYLATLEDDSVCRIGFEERAGLDGALFRDPWFDGSNYEATIVVTPNSGTHIQGEGTRPDLVDDAVAKIVYELLENRNLTGKVIWRDYPMHTGESGDGRIPQEHSIGIREPAPEVPKGHVRFVSAELASEVDLSIPQTAVQAGRQVWQFLYTDARGGVPTDFVDRHLILDPDIVCVWGRRGIGMAAKPKAESRIQSVQQLLEILTKVATVAGDQVTALRRHLTGECCERRKATALPRGRIVQSHKTDRRSYSNECHTIECQTNFTRLLDDLHVQLADIADLQRQMALPEGRFLFPFFQASRLGEVLASVRDSHIALSTRADNRTMRESLAKIQEVEENTDWLEIIVIGVYLLELVSITSQPESRRHPWFLIVSWFGGLLLAGLLGWVNARKNISRAWRFGLQLTRLFALLWVVSVLLLGLFWSSIFPETRNTPNLAPSTSPVSSPLSVDKPTVATGNDHTSKNSAK
jgi:hypothetical protein